MYALLKENDEIINQVRAKGEQLSKKQAAQEAQNDRHVGAVKFSSTSPLIDDLFGGDMSSSLNTSEHSPDDAPFADVSFHAPFADVSFHAGDGGS